MVTLGARTDFGKQVLHVTLKPSRVVSLSPSLDRGPIKHCFNATAKPCCRFVLSLPDRHQDFYDVVTVYLADGTLAYYGIGVLLQCVGPLLCVFGILPGWL